MATHKDIETILHLSPLQEGLLFHAVADRHADPYFDQIGFLLQGPLDPDAFQRVWQAIASRHPILRTGFAWEGVAKPVQIVRRRVEVPTGRHDWRGRGEAEREEALAALLAADRQAGFDLLKPPLMRLLLIRIEDDAWYFINSHHHLLLDGWSFALLLREVLITYQAMVGGALAKLPPPRPYRDYLAWVQARDPAAAERFWRGTLSGFAAPTPVPMEAGPEAAAEMADQGDDAFAYAEQVRRFSRAETESLAACARRHRVTLNTLVQGAWALLLARHSGESEVLFGTTVSGRPPELAGAEDIVGLLINSLPVRVRALDHEPLAAWLSRLQELNSELRQHEWTPLSSIQRWSDVPNGRSLFDTLVVFDSFPEDDANGVPMDLRVQTLPPPGRTSGSARLTAGRNNYPLSLIVEPTSELGLIVCYARRRLTHDAAARLLEQCRTLLQAMVERPQARLAELPLINGAERRRQLVDWNAVGRAASPDACVHELFEIQAQLRPDTTAVVCEETSFSYRELDRRANQVARRLRALGVGPDDRVALCVERSAAMIVGLLGILKAGAAYVPLDPKFPRERLRSVVEDSGARAVITHASGAAAFAELGVKLLCVDSEEAALGAEVPDPLGPIARPENLAYLIYTSGSTGRPKGVAVEHRHLVSYVRGVLARLPLAEIESFALASTVAADLGHTSLFGALCSGRTLHVLSDERIFDPDGMAEYMSRHRVDALKIVPSHLSALLAAAKPERVLPRRCLVLGGEASSRELIDRIRALAPASTLLNHYGPTETTVGALTWEIGGAEGRTASTVPIGRPLANARAYILDRSMEPMPIGVPGELYLGGASVARGYHDRPALTAERFVPDPFGDAPGGRLYRTGDRARYRKDGAIEFLGRTDHQIKLRGYRVELGEIEAQLREAPEVREAVVVVREEGEAKRLIAYAVAREGAVLAPTALLELLSQRLPDYMVPSLLVPLAELPLTANGKIDRAALPDPEQVSQPRGKVHLAPRNDVETLLARIWAEVLRRESVGIHDDFFELGGDSILSLQIIARAKREGLRLLPKQLFAHRTIAALAAALAEALVRPELPAPQRPLEPAPFSLARLERAELDSLRASGDIEDVLPASPVQQGMLFHALLTPETNPYFNQIVCRFTQGLDLAAFAQAWRMLSARHAILRTGFISGVAEPHQVVRRTVSLPLEVLDWRERSEAEQATALSRYLQQDRRRGFRFEEPPIMRLAVMRLSEDVHQIVWSVHHALLDGWCQGLLLKEWLAFYDEGRRGVPRERGAAPPYRRYIAWLQRQDMAAAEAFFRAHLRGLAAPTRLPELTLAPAPDSHGFREHRARLSPGVTRAVQGFAQAQGVTLNTVVQAAWTLVLARYSGDADVLFGVTVAGRPADLPDAGSIMGVFINLLPLRVRVPPALRLADWLQQIQATNLELRQYEYSPLVQVQGWSEVARGTPLFESLLVFQNYPMDEAVEEYRRGLGIELRAEEAWTNYPLTVYVVPGSELTLMLSFDTQRFDGGAVARMAESMCALLERMAGQPEARLAELSLPGEAERQELVAAWDATRRDYRSRPCLPQMLAEQAARTPHAVAVTFGQEHLTYGELNARANQLSRYLRRQGVGPETLVGLCLERSLEMLVGALGILKSGGAYVPLDPGYPRERLRTMLEDSRAPLLLTQEGLWQDLPDTGVRAICLDRDWPSIAGEPDVDPTPLLREESLAYVIYTSGSTGRPKGVMVCHGSVTNFLLSMKEHLAPRSDVVVLATTSISFDIAVLEMFLPLLVGGRVVLARREEAMDGERLATLLSASGATWMQATPTGWKMLLEGGRPELAGLTVLCGGEAFPRELARKLLDAGVAPWNLYGPTETTVWSSIHRVISDDGPIPLGCPIANTAIHVLDRQLNPVPIGVAGEIYIGGAGLARGYLNRPALTAERFVPDPFSQEPGRRLYRTGDMARLREDGSIEFLGRVDHQLKIRGFRIEPGEIEAQLRAHPDVRDAVVVAREDAGTPRLAAYVIPEGSATPTAHELRSFLQERLPDYMVPSAYVCLDELPLTANGKMNRKALPAPDAISHEQTTRPRTGTEETVAGIWMEVLGFQAVGVDESFFELGGHSLLATRVISRIRAAFQVELPLRSIFDHPTVAKLAHAVDDAVGRQRGMVLPPITRQPRDGKLLLSFAQQRLWFLEQLEGQRGLLTIPFALRLTGPLDTDALRKSFEAVIDRHEILRTAFFSEQGEPWQAILPLTPFDLPIADLSALAVDVSQAPLSQRMDAIFATAFDLQRPPLLRCELFRLGPQEHVLAVALHHIITDAWSISILAEEVMTAYRSLGEHGVVPEQARPELQYADYAIWQRQHLEGRVWQQQMAYWRQQLAGSTTSLTLPGARLDSTTDRRCARLRRTLPRRLADALQHRAEQQGATLFMVLYAALNVVLHQQTGRSDLLVATDIANRHRRETESMIGFFVNQLVLRCHLDGAQRFAELLAQCKRTALDAYQHQDLPFDALVADLLPQRDAGRSPFFQIKLILQNVPQRDLELAHLVIAELTLEPRDVEVDVLVNAVVSDDGLHVTYDHRADLYSPGYIEQLALLYETVLEAVIESESCTVEDLVTRLHDQQQTLRQQALETGRAARDQQRAALGLVQRKPLGARNDS